MKHPEYRNPFFLLGCLSAVAGLVSAIVVDGGSEVWIVLAFMLGAFLAIGKATMDARR